MKITLTEPWASFAYALVDGAGHDPLADGTQEVRRHQEPEHL